MDSLIRQLPLSTQPLLLPVVLSHAQSVGHKGLPEGSPTQGGDLVSTSVSEEAGLSMSAMPDSSQEQACQEALERGYQQGLLQGQQEAVQHHKHKLESLAKLLVSLGARFEQQIDALEDIAVEIAMSSIVKILGETLITPQGVRAVVGQVLVQARTTEKLRVGLAPADFYLLLQHKASPEFTLPANVELVPDERVELGGCILDAAGGGLDARLETQLTRLKDVLLSTRQARGAKA